MSRCFPFPPPGYEKKPRPEEDLFQKEKQREKKHKKEKKSKRKREGDEKEERNKDREKQKDKKEKKDKHRDKKDKEKIKSKDKDKSSISVDATTSGQPETSGRVNTGIREECSHSKSHGFSENKFTSAFQGQNGWGHADDRLVNESEESKFVQELGRRIKDEGKAIGSQTVQTSSSSERKGYEEMHRSAVTGLENSVKYMERGRDQGLDPKKVDDKLHERIERKGVKDGLQLNGNHKVQNLTGSTDRKVETPPEPVQRVIERAVQEKDKSKEKNDDKRGEKRKDRDKKEKKSHGKDKGRDTEKKKEKERTENKKRDQDRSKELYRNDLSSSSKNINVYSSQVDNKVVSTEENVKKRKDVEANGFGHENEIRSSKLRTHQLMNNGKILEACQSTGLLDSNRMCIPLQDKVETKYHELNGTIGPQLSCMPKQKPTPAPTTRSDQPFEALEKSLLADKVVEASRKLPQAPVVVEASRKLLQAPVVVEASRKLLQSPVLVHASTEGPLAGKNIETLSRARQATQIAEPLKKHPRADCVTEPSRKPPHPDLKYLSEVLSVPKIEEWSGVDEQEWLFSNKDLPLEKQKPDVSVDSRQLRVWSETLHIESADIYALPYVIPY